MPEPDTDADVLVRVPADGAFVSVLRTTTAGLAARLDFTLDVVEDLRIAVGEACAMVLPESDPDGDLTAEFFLGTGSIRVVVSVPCVTPFEPDQDSFAWQVLDTLADHAEASQVGGRFAVTVSLAAEEHPAAGA
jgi:serine/threonine-protein kinase RsbW